MISENELSKGRLFIVALFICATLALPHFLRIQNNQDETTDFRAYYSAAVALQFGVNPYLPLDGVGRPLAPDDSTGYQYLYTPVLILVLEPFVHLPFNLLELGMLLLQILSGAVACLLIYVYLSKEHGLMLSLPQFVAGILILCGSTFYYNYITGQIDILTLPLFLGVLLCLYRSPLLAGVFFAMMLLTKHNSMFLVIPFTLLAGMRFVWGFVVTLLAVWVATLPLLGISVWEQFVRAQVSGTAAMQTLPAALDVYNLGLTGVVARLSAESNAELTLIVLGTVLIFMGSLWFARKSTDSKNASVWFFPMVAVSLLILPRFWPQHIALLLPMFFVILFETKRQGILLLAIAGLLVLWIQLVPGFVPYKFLHSLGITMKSGLLTSVLSVALLTIFLLRSFVSNYQSKNTAT